MTGYISNLRIVKGTAVYTSNFTPTVPLNNVNNTQLLLLVNSDNDKDVSKNKKGNFENVKVEWRELKKNKSQLKVVMDNAKIWLNANNIKN